MHKIFIFALLLFASCEDITIQKKCQSMTFSPASPLTWVSPNCDSFNRSEICAVFQKCYCQPFNCNDTIKDQFQDDGYLEDYFIRLKDEDDNTLAELPYTKTIVYKSVPVDLAFVNNSFPFGISSWSQLNTGGASWNWDAPSGAIADGTSGSLPETNLFYQSRQRGWPPGYYEITVRLYNNSNSGSSPLQETLFIEGGQLDTGSPTGRTILQGLIIPRNGTTYSDFKFFFTTTEKYDYLGFSAIKQGTTTGSVIIMKFASVTVNRAPSTESIEWSAVYDVSFVPSEHGICDQKISAELWNDATPDVLKAYTDCLDIKTNHECSYLVGYENHRNYAGLNYSNLSPDPMFYLRIKMEFFIQRFPEEDEIIELSNSRSITVNSSIRAQRKIKTDFMPFYMHRKLQLALKHQTVQIDGQEWVKKEAYEIQENTNRRFPLVSATCWLNEKNFVQRNVI